MIGQEKAALSVEETAKYLGIGRSLCYRMIREGKYTIAKVGKQDYYSESQTGRNVKQIARFKRSNPLRLLYFYAQI